MEQTENMPDEEKNYQQECFNLFADTFGKCMVKRELWKNKLSRNPNLYFSDVVTISDEAFAIFTIERNWNIWKNEHDGAEVKLRSGEYTTLNTNVKYGGWTKEGMKRFENLCKNVMNVRRHFKVRAEMEKIYKLEKFPQMGESNITDQIPMKTNREQVEDHCCWNEFMLESEDEEHGTYDDENKKMKSKHLPTNTCAKTPYQLELPNNKRIDSRLNTQDQYAQPEPPSDVLSDKDYENSDDDNTDSQSFGNHSSDDGGQMNHDDRYDYHSETSATY